MQESEIIEKAVQELSSEARKVVEIFQEALQTDNQEERNQFIY